MSKSKSEQNKKSRTRKFRRASYVRDRYDISDPTLYRWCNSGKFPPPQYLNGQRVWLDDVIEAAEAKMLASDERMQNRLEGGV